MCAPLCARRPVADCMSLALPRGVLLATQIMVTYTPTGAVSVFPTDEVVEQAIERLSVAVPPPPTPPSTPASAPSPPPPGRTCAAGDGACPAEKSRGTVHTIAGMATATAAMAAEVGAHIASPRSQWSLLVAVVTTIVVYVATKVEPCAPAPPGFCNVCQIRPFQCVPAVLLPRPAASRYR